jgi:hypothetical protein
MSDQISNVKSTSKSAQKLARPGNLPGNLCRLILITSKNEQHKFPGNCYTHWRETYVATSLFGTSFPVSFPRESLQKVTRKAVDFRT